MEPCSTVTTLTEAAQGRCQVCYFQQVNAYKGFSQAKDPYEHVECLQLQAADPGASRYGVRLADAILSAYITSGVYEPSSSTLFAAAALEAKPMVVQPALQVCTLAVCLAVVCGGLLATKSWHNLWHRCVCYHL